MTAFKRFLLILLTLTLMIPTVPAALAADWDLSEGDTYVLQKLGMGPPGYTNYGTNYQYQSPYSAFYTFEGMTNGQSKEAQPGLFSMINGSTGDVIPTYCLDIMITAVGGAWYRRQNLDDSTYSGSVSGQIRAIMQNGFYIDPDDYGTTEAHEAAVNAEVARLAAAARVESLTLGEAISATQLAIWQAAHGTLLNFNPFAVEKAYKPNTAGVVYATLCGQEMNGWTKSGGAYLLPDVDATNARILAVYNYLLSLDPVAGEQRTVSPSSFISLTDPVPVRNEDGTYDVSVTTTVDVDMAGGDELTLKAEMGSHSAFASLHGGTQTVTLTLTGIPAGEVGRDVNLSISGYQTVSGVFLFDAQGERGSSQTMVGKNGGRLPVYAQVVAKQSRVLNFVKATVAGAPLEGIIFDIHFVASLQDYLNGTVTLPDPNSYSYTELADYTVITDRNGYASLNFTQHGLQDGVYLVVEHPHPAIVAPLDPFYLILPATNAEGTGYDYELTIYPKNEVKDAIDIEKDVISLNNDLASVDAYAPHPWIISATIPEDIAFGKSYVVSDTLDNRLDYMGNMVVTVETADGATVAATLAANHYTLTVHDADSLAEGNPSDAFTVALTREGMNAVSNAVGTANYGDYRLRVYFDARINANGTVNEYIPNQATIRYVNSVNFTYDAESDIPQVYTGAANLLKVDALDRSVTLSGAEFEVYRPATPEELASNSDSLVTLKGLSGSFVKVSFFAEPSFEGTKVDSAATGDDGRLAIYGLAYGKYYLVETKAPAGYNLLGDPMELNITEISHQEEMALIVENVSGTVLPETGGIGTTVFTFGGAALMGISLLLILTKKRLSAGTSR